MAQRNEPPLQQRSFVYCFRPIYYFARVSGQMPFTITHIPNSSVVEATFNKRDLIWFAYSLCVHISFVRIAIEGFKVYKHKSSETSTTYFGNYTIWFISLLLGIGNMVFDACNRFKIVKILNKVTIFDKEIVRFGIDFDYKTANRYAWLQCAVIILAISLVLAATFHTLMDNYVGDDFLYKIFFFFSSGLHQNQILAAPLLTYIYLLRNLQKRYAALNQLLRKRICDENEWRLLIDADKEQAIETIKFIGRYHGHLTRIMDLLNFCCSFQIMIMAAIIFAVSVLTYYSFYRYVVQQNDQFRSFAWVHAKFQLYHLVLILTITYNANRMINEGKRTARIAYDKINCCKDPDVSFPLSQLSLQVENRHPTATCGLFPFDWTLLYTMVAAATTYLTVLLSFGQQDDTGRNQTCQHQSIK